MAVMKKPRKIIAEAIFLSAGVPDARREPGYASTANTVAITAAVSALVHVVLGRRPLVWGGHPAITPMIWMIAQDIGVDYGSWVHLYQSKHFKDEYPEDNEQFRNVTYTPDIERNREKSLLQMRTKMFEDNAFESGVFIGGMSGVVQEFEMFQTLQPSARVVPVLSTGGATLDLGKRLGVEDGSDLEEDLDYVSLFHRHLDISVKEERYRHPGEQPKEISKRFWRPGSK